MRNDEFAFFNQQLAAMLRDGIPLEGALQRLCADMKKSPVRAEMEELGLALGRGVPLAEALRQRQLPDLYKGMVEVGILSNDLPGVLTLLADHYEHENALWLRLRGLMVYPVIVLLAAFALSCFLSFLALNLLSGAALGLGFRPPGMVIFEPWISPILLGTLLVFAVVAASTPWVRRSLRWRAPAFREASLASIASALAMMLRSGVSLKNALALAVQLERGTRAELELARWWQNLSEGHGKFAGLARDSKVFPPLFVWTVEHSGEDLAVGFQRVADLYQARARYRSEILLYAALPCAVLFLGLMIVTQVAPVGNVIIGFINDLSQ